jgi:ribosomal protein L7Ae-like RNA K-turn-binding protein
MSDTDEQLDEADWETLADRVRQGMMRRQVTFGKGLVATMARRGQIGMVWVTEDLSKNAFGKLAITCAKLDVPLLRAGDSESVGEITGEPSVKVYILRKGFSGLRQILRSYDEYLDQD